MWLVGHLRTPQCVSPQPASAVEMMEGMIERMASGSHHNVKILVKPGLQPPPHLLAKLLIVCLNLVSSTFLGALPQTSRIQKKPNNMQILLITCKRKGCFFVRKCETAVELSYSFIWWCSTVSEENRLAIHSLMQQYNRSPCRACLVMTIKRLRSVQGHVILVCSLSNWSFSDLPSAIC